MTPSCTCGQPSPDAFLCRDCTTALGATLTEIPGDDGLAYHLALSLTRQGITGDHTPTRNGASPLPYDPRAATVRTHLSGVLWLWATALGMPLPAPGSHEDAYVVLPPMTTTAQWLLDHMNAVSQHTEAGTIAAELTTAVDRGWQVVNLRAQRVYAGPCDCGTHLYGHPGRGLVSCPACGTTWGIAERQDWMRSRLAGHLATAHEAALMLAGIGIHVSDGTIRMWHHRGHLAAEFPNGVAHPRYRLGDIADRVFARDARAGLRGIMKSPRASERPGDTANLKRAGQPLIRHINRLRARAGRPAASGLTAAP